MGYNRLSKSLLTADSSVDPSSYGINTGVTKPLDFGMPQINISGFLPTGENSGWPQLVVPAETFQFADNAASVGGAHAIKSEAKFVAAALTKRKIASAKDGCALATMA